MIYEVEVPMHDEDIKSLAKVRIERAYELIEDAEELLRHSSFRLRKHSLFVI
jgi:hypothetical protein